MMKKPLLLATALISVMALAGCAKDINPRGNKPHNDALDQLSVGEQTQRDVVAIMGTPSTVSPFNPNEWYYISAQTSQYAFFEIEELERQIHVLEFDNRGILSGMRLLDLEDGIEVAVAEKETPTLGREFSVLEQLLGNLGRFSSGDEPRQPGP